MVPTWLKSLFSRRTTRKPTIRRSGPASKPNLVQLEDRAVPASDFTINDVTQVEGNAGTTNFMFTVSLNRDAADTGETLTVDYATANNTATAPSDYTAKTTTTLTFAPGTDSNTVTITVNGDNTVEIDETFFVNLTNATSTGGMTPTISDAQGLGTITNDDTATISFGVSPSAQENTGNLIFTVTIDNPVDVDVTADRKTADGTALAASDYTALANANITLFAANSTASKSISVAMSPDNLVELDETLSLILSNLAASGRKVMFAGGAASITDTGEITNDDTATVSISSPSVTEGGSLAFVVSIDNPVDASVTAMRKTADGTAKTTAPSDYTALADAAITLFNANSTTTKTINVATTGDAIVEANETISLILSSLAASGRTVQFAGGGANLTGTGTIENDDKTTLTIADKSVSEATGTVTFTVVSSNAVQGSFTIDYTTNDGTAKAGSDYTAKSETLTFDGTAGESKSFSVTITNENLVEADESFSISLLNLVQPAGIAASAFDITDTATGTITNDDSAQFKISATASATEGSPVVFTVTLTNPVDVTTSVTVTTADVSALAGTHYTALVGKTVTFVANDQSETVSVTTAGNNQVTGDLTFKAMLGGLMNGGRPTVTIDAGNSTGIGTIVDDDIATFSIANASAIEGNTITFTVTLSNPVNADTSVKVTTANLTADGTDYTGVTDLLVPFAKGTTSQMVMITTAVDTIVEADETFKISLGSLDDGGKTGKVVISGVNGTAIGTITNDDSTTLTVDDVTVMENVAGGLATFKVTLSNGVQNGFKVDYKTVNGTAIAGKDFTDTTGTLTFAGMPGESQMFTVAITNENLVELDEMFTVQLFNIVPTDAGVSAAKIATDTATGKILNDDSAEFKIAKMATAAEGSPVMFLVTLTNPVDVTTSVNATTTDGVGANGAKSPQDFTALSGALVSFPAGTTSQTVSVTTKLDMMAEPTEDFSIAIGSLVDGGRAVTISATDNAGTGFITSADVATFSIANVSAVEGNTLTFTVSLSIPVAVDTSVKVTTADNTAADGVDYKGVTDLLVSFPAGTTSQQVMIPTNADTIVEADETFKISLGSLDDGGLVGQVVISGVNGSAIGTITNDDSTALTVDDVMVAEASGLAKFTVTLSNAVQGGFTVQYKTVNGTAIAGSDYVAKTGTLTFAGDPNEQQSFTVSITDENLVELDETFTIELFNVVPTDAGVSAAKINATDKATGTILNDDAAIVSIMDASISEGGLLSFLVTIDNPVDVAVTADRKTADGSATVANSDYTPLANANITLFAAGSTANKTIQVTTTVDKTVEPDEMLSLILSNLGSSSRPVTFIGGGATLTGTGTIVNDDSAEFSIADAQVVEGGMVTFTITLSNPVSTDTSVTLTTADGTAIAGDDYTAVAGDTIMFPAGTTSKQFSVATKADLVVEADETFTATLGGLIDGGFPGKVTISGTNGTATGTILNDDSATLVTVSNVMQNEDAGTMTFMVQLSADVQDGFTVKVSTKDGTMLPATVGDGDYTGTVEVISFAGMAGETKMLVVPITADLKVEANETFTVHLSDLMPNNAKVDASKIDISSVGTGTITNDDTTKLTVEDVSGLEDGGPITFTVTLSNPVQGGLKVDFATADITALLSDNDYNKSNGTLIFAGNAGETQKFMVPINADVTIEPDETFKVSLSNVVTLGPSVDASKVDTTDTAIGTILSDDKAVIDLIASTDVEGNNLIYTITLTNKISKDIMVDFATLAGVGVRPAISDVDFTAVNKTILIPANTKMVTVTVPLVDDRRVEGSEQFESQITNIQADASVIGALSFGTAKATATITDNDSVTAVFTNAANGSLEDNIAGITATVELTVNAVGTGTDGIDRTVVVRVANMGGTATNGVDYKNFTNPTDLTFAKADFTKTSQNIAFDLVEDLNKEGDETIVFGISLQSDATAGQASIGATKVHTYSIQSDDEITRTYDATVAGDYRFVNDGSGNVQLFLGPTLLSTDAIGSQPILLNGTAGVDSATVDYSKGSMVPSGGITFNGANPAVGERFIVSGGAFTSIVNTFTGAQSGTLVLAGTTNDTLNYTATDAVEITAGSVGNLTIQLPAASDAILEDDGIAGNGISQIRSGNGTFATTKFVNPTGTLSIATGNAADTLTINDILGTTSTIIVGSATNRFASITQVGDVVSNGDVRYFANAIAINNGADLTASKAVELNAANTVALGTTNITAADFSQTGASKVAINAGALATVSGTATINFAGTIDGPGSLTTSGSATSVFQQPIGAGTALAGATFGSKIDATATGTATVTGGTTGGRFNVRANTVALNAALDATGGPVVVRLTGGTATQSAPITATKLYLEGSGTFTLNNAGNQLTGDGKTIASFVSKSGLNFVTDETNLHKLGGELFVKLSSGSIEVRDKTDLILRFEDPTEQPAIAIAGGGNVTLIAGADVSIEDPRAADSASKPTDIKALLNVGAGEVKVFVGVDRDNNAFDSKGDRIFDATIVRYLAEAVAGSVTLGSPPTPTNSTKFDGRLIPDNNVFIASTNFENVAKDTFTIRPMLGAPLIVHGNSPVVQDPLGARPFDSISPRFAGVGSISLVPAPDNSGKFSFSNNFKDITFTSIESLGGISANAFVVQTGPSTATAANAYAIRFRATISGEPLGGTVSGNGIITNPFVVSPSLGGSMQFKSPQIAFADIDGDGTSDLIVANGAGDAPIVTVIRGNSLFQNGKTINISALDKADIITQFFAFEESFRGGVQVRAADFNSDGKAEIAVSAGNGGGPRIVVYQIDSTAGANVFKNATIFGSEIGKPYNFFPYESDFRGGVNVAIGDVNGDGVPDIIAGAGVGGGPRVRVYDGSIAPPATDNGAPNPSIIADFFAYDAGFRGGVFVDAGRFDGDTIADLVTAPGLGGGPHIQVFQGRKVDADPVRDPFLVAGQRTLLASFFAFEAQSNLFGQQPNRAGVGSVAFGSSTDGQGGLRSLLVTRPSGVGFEVLRFELVNDNPLNLPTIAPVAPSGMLMRTTTDFQNSLTDFRVGPDGMPLRDDDNQLISFNGILLDTNRSVVTSFEVLQSSGSAAGTP